MEKLRKTVSWVAIGVCAAGLIFSTVGHCDEQEIASEAQIPVGSRMNVGVKDVIERPALCVEEAEDAQGQIPAEEIGEDDGSLTLNMFLSDSMHPGATHQIVECLTGPVGIPLVDGRVYMLPPGVYVRLEDTSIWRIMDADLWAIQDWLPSDRLHLTANKTWFATPYQYSLGNLNTQVKVRVRPEVGPKGCWSLRRFIYDRSLIANEIILNDGSMWRVTRADAGVFSHWLPDDSVIIGVNTDWMSCRRPHILINLTTNDYVRCSWIR